MENRTNNSKKNILMGLMAGMVSIILPFINRTVILYILGYEYQGLNTLFSSILATLSLTELGVSSAVVFCMYRAVAEKNTDEQCALLNYFRKLYRWIGFIILLIGMILLPFIKYLIKGGYPSTINIYFLYFLFLVQTVVSYLILGYNGAIFSAYQKESIVSKIQIIVSIFRCVLQFAILLLTKNFYIFVMISIVGNLFQNIAITIIARRQYPFLSCRGDISVESKKKIKEKIQGLLLNRVSNEIRNSSDNIVVSIFLGLRFVTIYGNYYYVMSAIYGFFLIIVRGMIASVGNSVVAEPIEKNYDDFLLFEFIFAFLNCICTCCLFSVFQVFMGWWAGDELTLHYSGMVLFCVYFYTLNVNNPINLYFETNGLWDKAKLLFMFTAISNLVLDILLGAFIGIDGILIATSLTIIVFSIVGRAKILYREYFKCFCIRDFLVNEGIYFVITIFCCLIIQIINRRIGLEGVIGIVSGLLVAILVSGLIWVIVFMKKAHFKQSILLIKRVCRKGV